MYRSQGSNECLSNNGERYTRYVGETGEKSQRINGMVQEMVEQMPGIK